MSKQKKHPLVLAHVNIYKGDVLTVCNADGSKLHPAYLTARNKGEYTVSHWDDTWLYYGDGEKGEIDWLFCRIIKEGKKPANSDPAMFKKNKEAKGEMKYQVGITINNCFEVEAENGEKAEEIVREYDLHKTCEDMDFNITYVDEVEAKKREQQ